MAQPQRIGDLEILQDDNFQSRIWTIERIGWIIVVGFIVVALLGLTGRGGILSDQTKDAPDSLLQIEYERFVRLQTPIHMRVNVQPAAQKDSKIQILLSQEYLRGIEIVQVTPQPESTEIGSEWLTYTFNTSAGNQPATITFSLFPPTPGSVTGKIAVAGREPVKFEQFIYP